MAADQDFFSQLASPRFCERLFAHLPDVVFCLKDRERRYQAANQAFAERAGLDHSDRLIGRRAEDIFTPELAATYRAQDEQVLSTGREICDALELITNRNGSLGWYLASKVPLHDARGRVIGLASISRDLATPNANDVEFAGVARTVETIRKHFDEPLRPEVLAGEAGLSMNKLDRRMRKVFHLSVSQFIRKTRIGNAAQWLTTTDKAIATIALDCGYGDQTAFTRQFRATVGLPPAAYREHSRRHV